MKGTNLILVWSMVAAATLESTVFAERKNWVLLIAGSNTYKNYRHQADVCHAYQIVHANGIPDEQIVVMMYDDIANNTFNPYPGNIINRPGGPNVYPGVLKDYVGDDVNAATFLKVLQGEKGGIFVGSGKVIDSGPDDYVFVYYADHGGPGRLGMPSEPYLKATDINKALKSMHEKKKFAKLVFYVEACHSGSIFDQLLPDNISVYATTASNPDEHSKGCYCQNDRGSCLGDVYSVKWMENSDSANLHIETLQKQFEIVRNETNTSHVQQYGDKSFTSLTMDQFLGTGNKSLPGMLPTTPLDAVPVDDIPIYTYEQLLEGPMGKTHREEILSLLEEERWLKDQTQTMMEQIADLALPGTDIIWAVETRGRIEQWDCYDYCTDLLIELCPRLQPSTNNYILTRLNTLVNLCNIKPRGTVVKAIERVTQELSFCH